MTNKSDLKTFYFSASKLILIALFFVVCTLIIFNKAAQMQRLAPYEWHVLFYWFLAAGCLTLSGLAAWMLATVSRPVVTVSAKGLWDRRLTSVVVPWNEIQGVLHGGSKRSPTIAMVVRPGVSARYGRRTNFLSWERRRWGAMERLNINVRPLAATPEQVLNAIRSEMDAAAANSASSEQVVAFYQQLGFFVGSTAKEVIESFCAHIGRAPDAEKPWDDVLVLSLDPEHVWTGDPEADVSMGSSVYVRVLKEWGEISQGAFAPTKITETWAGAQGPVQLHLKSNGTDIVLSPAFIQDWIDLEILRGLDEILTPSGKTFEYVCDGNFAIVLCLTRQQKASMRELRKFPFVN